MIGRAIGSRNWHLWSTLAALALAATGTQTLAQTPATNSPRVQAVDDNRTADWPPGPWQAVPRLDYFELVEKRDRRMSRPRSAWIQSADYSAQVDRNRLRNGTLTLNVVNNSKNPQTIPLAPLGLAIESLDSNGKPLPWGTNANGFVVLVVPPGSTTVTGRWNLAGRPIASLVEFHVPLAPAVQSSLTLDVPTTLQLTTSHGHITNVTATRSAWISFAAVASK